MMRDSGWLAAALIGVGLAGPAAALTATTICETTGPSSAYTVKVTDIGPTVTYPQTIVVPAYQIRNGVCLMPLSPADRARVGGAR